MKKVVYSVFLSVALAGCGGGGGGGSSDSALIGDDSGNRGQLGSDNGGQGDSGGSASVYNEREWITGFQISNPNREARNPSVKALGDGTVFAAWVESATTEQPAAVFASVLRADMTDLERRRDALQISQLDDGNQTVLANTRWNFTGEAERFIPSPKLAASNNGVGHVAWLQTDGIRTSVYVSDYVPQSGTWSPAASVESTNNSCGEIKLLALANGDAVLLWKQDGDSGVALKGVAYSANTSSWGAVFDVSDAVKPGADIALWERNGGVAVAYLASVDAQNDSLMVADLGLPALTVSAEELDAAGLKASVVGAQFQSKDAVMWAEIDEFGYYSIAGSINTDAHWEAMPQIEDRPYDVGHLALASIGDELHVAWRQKDQSTTAITHDMNTVKYTNAGGVSEVKTIFDSGGANPVLVDGMDGKLYAQWFSSHTKYAEYVLGDGWKSVTMPFCMAGQVIGGSCYNGGTEHSIDVDGLYGVSAWLESVNNIRSVVISLSK